MKPSDDLIVSSVEPSGSNRKKVWIQKGKNFFDTSNLPSQSNLGIDISFENSAIKLNGTSTGVGILYNQKPTVITLKAGTYTFSLTKKGGTITRNNQEVGFYLRKQGTSTVLATLTLATFVSNDKKSETFTITEETEIDIYMYVNTSGMVFSNLILGIQLEQGPTATSYEAYIEPKIYVKNDNDVYEEFISKENLDNYSTEETKIGTWINGKPLYRKVISGYWSFETGDTNIAHNISNLDLCIRADLFRIDIGHTSWEFPYVSESGGFTGITKVTPENVIVKAYNDTWSNSNNGYIILEYTKTTD